MINLCIYTRGGELLKNILNSKEKISEKAFSQSLLISILSILLCIIFLCSATYAWFTDSKNSGESEIKSSGNCLITASIYKDNSEEAIATVDMQKKVTLDNMQGIYTVTLTLPKGSASGYLIITAGGQEYYSDYLQRNEDINQALTFTLYVQTMQNITFTAHWGIRFCDCRILNNKTLNIN